MHHRGRFGDFIALLNRSPQSRQKINVAAQIAFITLFPGRADDESAGRRLQRFDQFSQPVALALARNAARHADMLDGRHIHNVSPRQRNMARHPRALRAERLFRNLHHDLLIAGQQVLNKRAF